MRPVVHEQSEMNYVGRINPDELSESGQSNAKLIHLVTSDVSVPAEVATLGVKFR